MPLVYGTPANFTLSLAGLAPGAYRNSTAISNLVDLYLDYLVGGSIQVGTGPTNGSTIEIFGYGSVNNGTTYTGGVTGTDAVYSASGEEVLFRRLEVITVTNTSSKDYRWGPISFAGAYFGVMPSSFGVLVRNNTGVSFHGSGTNNFTGYQGLKLS